MPVLSSLSFSFLPSRLLAHEMVLPTLERHCHISRQLILKPPSQVCPEPSSSLGSLDPVEQIMLQIIVAEGWRATWGHWFQWRKMLPPAPFTPMTVKLCLGGKQTDSASVTLQGSWEQMRGLG